MCTFRVVKEFILKNSNFGLNIVSYISQSRKSRDPEYPKILKTLVFTLLFGEWYLQQGGGGKSPAKLRIRVDIWLRL